MIRIEHGILRGPDRETHLPEQFKFKPLLVCHPTSKNFDKPYLRLRKL
jgi:hypothetical protein